MRMAATKTPPNRVGRLVYPIEKSLRYSTKIKFTAIKAQLKPNAIIKNNIIGK